MSNIKKCLVMLSMITSVLIAGTMPVVGFNQNSPAQYTVNYIINTDTSFGVLLCGSPAQTEMNFNANSSDKLVEPQCQSKTGSIAWANITNQGNVNLNFSTNLTKTYTWVVLNIASNPSMSDQITATNSVLSPAGWLNIAPTNTVQLYSLANFTNAPVGQNSTALNIYSHS